MIDRKINIKIAILMGMLTILFVMVLLQPYYIAIVNAREVIGTLFFVVAVFCAHAGYNKIYFRDFELFKKRKKVLFNMVDYFSVVVSAILFLQIVFLFFFFPAIVSQTSMNLTLFEGDRVVIINGNQQLERFDIIVFRVDRDILFGVYPVEDDGLWVKRVIGLPGESIEFVNGLLYVDDNEVYEPYLYNVFGQFHDRVYSDTNGQFHAYNTYTHDFSTSDILSLMGLTGNHIPEGYYLLLGDNRSNSKDSRMIGFVPQSLIIGEGKFIIHSFFNWEKLGE